MDLYVTFGQRSVPIVDTEHVFGYSDLICNYLFKIRNRDIGFICTMTCFEDLEQVSARNFVKILQISENLLGRKILEISLIVY